MKSASIAAIALVLGSASVRAWAESPKDFISDAIIGDNSEIMLGRVAERSGASPQVRDFGHVLVKDHTKAKREASAVARRLGVTPPTRSSAAADAEYAKLHILSGVSFDREFSGYMVRDHQQDIADFQAEADGDTGPAGALARKQLPTLHKHLDMAQSIVDANKTAGQ
jgi:putative membrane protein